MAAEAESGSDSVRVGGGGGARARGRRRRLGPAARLGSAQSARGVKKTVSPTEIKS